MNRKRRDKPARARSPSVDIGGIPGIYEKTRRAIDFIDGLSGSEPEVSKAITSCTSIAIYSRYGLDDPFLVMDEMLIDCANHMSEMDEMFDPGNVTRTESRCPHSAQCKGSDCSLCIFAPIRMIDMSNIRRAYGTSQMTETSGSTHQHRPEQNSGRKLLETPYLAGNFPAYPFSNDYHL